MPKKAYLAEEAKWRAEMDARTLSDAAAIQSDPKRLSAAAKIAQKMQKEKLAEAKALGKIAKKAK